MTRCSHLLSVRQTNSVVMTAAVLMLVDDVTEHMTVQMAQMSMNAVNNFV